MKIQKARPKYKGVFSALLRSMFYALCSMFFLAGCATLDEHQEPQSDEGLTGQVTIYLNGADKSILDITFELSSVKIVSEDGTVKELTTHPISVNSMNIAGRQMLLAERLLPEGKYKKLQFAITESIIRTKGKKANLALPQDTIEVPINISVARNQNATVFFDWNADGSIVDRYLFKPVFSVKMPSSELSSLLIYVTNEDSNNVSVINRQSDIVVSTIMTGKKPKGIATGLGRDRLRVYVVNSASNSVSVIDPTTNKVSNEIPVRFGHEPVDIAVAKTGQGKELLFTANYGSNTVSVIDGLTYQEMEKVNVGIGPIAVAADPPVESVLNSRFLSQKDIDAIRIYRERFFNVYVANKNSKEVSILRMDMQTNRCVEVITASVEWNPVAITVDYQRGKVYVANHGSDKLSLIDIVQMVQGNRAAAVSSINNVGNYGIGIVPDPTFDRLYFLREVPGQVLILKAFSEGRDPIQTRMPQIMGVIGTGSSPRSLALDPEARKLYIVNRGANNVSVVDKTTRNELQVIPVGRRPYGIAVFPF